MQQIDGLKPSDYLIETAKQNIEGDITIEEVKQRIDSYYKIHPTQKNEDRTEEHDFGEQEDPDAEQRGLLLLFGGIKLVRHVGV